MATGPFHPPGVNCPNSPATCLACQAEQAQADAVAAGLASSLGHALASLGWLPPLPEPGEPPGATMIRRLGMLRFLVNHLALQLGPDLEGQVAEMADWAESVWGEASGGKPPAAEGSALGSHLEGRWSRLDVRWPAPHRRDYGGAGLGVSSPPPRIIESD